jgi:nicotinate-nucleotide pyrophosphorylase (carboxylating)
MIRAELYKENLNVEHWASADTLIQLALTEDFGERGDVTSQATIPASKLIVGRVIAKDHGVIAGLPLIARVYAQIDPQVQIQLCVEDGATVTPQTLIAEVRGTAHSILSGERTALNFLQRLSGIATLTAQFVAAVQNTKTRILDTRKTTPGWRLLEKYAVRLGGGENHRIGLYDMVLIKDNHIDTAGSITAAVNAARNHAFNLPIEVEVRNFEELREVLALDVNRIMLDNMTDEQLREAVTITAGRVPLEASGNMSLARVTAVAATGVDYISVGALTHSAPALDLSMKITPS